MFITVIRISNEKETVTVYALSDETVDYSEYIYQEWETEGYNLENIYTEPLDGNTEWKPEFIESVKQQPDRIFIERRFNN